MSLNLLFVISNIILSLLPDDERLKDLTGKFPSQNEIRKARILFNQILDEEFKIKAQTIHSFCQTIIKIFPFEAKIAPNFEVLESAKEILLLKQAVV